MKGFKCTFGTVSGFVDGKEVLIGDHADELRTLDDAKRVCEKLRGSPTSTEPLCGGFYEIPKEEVGKTGFGGKRNKYYLCQKMKQEHMSFRWYKGDASYPPQEVCLEATNGGQSKITGAPCKEGQRNQLWINGQYWVSGDKRLWSESGPGVYTDSDGNLKSTYESGASVTGLDGATRWEVDYPGTQTVQTGSKDLGLVYVPVVRLKKAGTNECLEHHTDTNGKVSLYLDTCVPSNELHRKTDQWIVMRPEGKFRWKKHNGITTWILGPKPVKDFKIKQPAGQCFLEGDFKVRPAGYLSQKGDELIDTVKDKGTGRNLIGTLNSDGTQISWDTVPATYWRRKDSPPKQWGATKATLKGAKSGGGGACAQPGYKCTCGGAPCEVKKGQDVSYGFEQAAPQEPSTSNEDCRQKCSRLEECTIWIRQPSTGTCFMSKQKWGKYFSSKNDRDAGFPCDTPKTPKGCVKANVGSSGRYGNSKTVQISCASAVCPTNVNKGNWLGGHTYGDRFKVTQSGTEVKVTRTNGRGWGLDLKFLCCEP
jgi:hypothetical protein